MRHTSRIIACGLTMLTSNLGAQSLDSMWVGLSSRQVWRGYDLGRIGAVAGTSASALGIGDQYSWQLALDLEAAIAGGERPPSRADSRVAALLKLVYTGDTDNRERLWFGAGGNVLPRRSTSKSTAEVAAAYEREIPWLEERRPVLGIQAVHDFVRHRATLVQSTLALDYKVANTMTALITLGQSWSDFPAHMAPGNTAFRWHATSLQCLVNIEPEFLRKRNYNVTVHPLLDLIYAAHSPESFYTSHGLRVSVIH